MAEGEKDFTICTLRAIGGKVKTRKVGRDVYYWFMNCGSPRSPVQRVIPWELILGHDTRIVKYRYLFAGSELRFMTLKSSIQTIRHLSLVNRAVHLFIIYITSARLFFLHI